MCLSRDDGLEGRSATDGLFSLQVLQADVCTQDILLQNADVVVMNNVFEYFMEPEQQVR